MFLLFEASLFPLLYTAVLGYSSGKFMVSMFFGLIAGAIMDYVYCKNNIFTLRLVRGKRYFKALFALIPFAVFCVMMALCKQVVGISHENIFKTALTSQNKSITELIQRAYASIMVMMISVTGVLLCKFLVYPVIERCCELLGVHKEGKIKTLVLIIRFLIMIPISLIRGLLMGLVDSVVNYVQSFKENIR